MEVEDLQLIKCFVCREIFKHEDSICTISTRIYNEKNLDFSEVWTTQVVSVEDRHTVTIKKEVNFHLECFKSIAGEEYVP